MDTKNQEITKLYEKIGAIKIARLFGNVSDAVRYGIYKQIKDTESYKLLGKNWVTFCKEDLGRDQKTVDAEIKMLEEFGESFLSAAEKIGLRKKDLYALDKGFSAADKINIREGILMDGTKKIAITQDNCGEIAELITKLVDKTKEAEAEASKAKHDCEAKYNTSKAAEKKCLKAQKELEEADKQIKLTSAELQFSVNPEAKNQQAFVDSVDRNFKDVNPIFLFLDNHISNMQKLKDKKGSHYPPKAEVSLLTFSKYCFEMSRLYYESLEHVVGIADGDVSALDQKYIDGLEKEVKEHWANMLYPKLQLEGEEADTEDRGENNEDHQS